MQLHEGLYGGEKDHAGSPVAMRALRSHYKSIEDECIKESFEEAGGVRLIPDPICFRI